MAPCAEMEDIKRILESLDSLFDHLGGCMNKLTERRLQHDRRRADGGPPEGCAERRVRVDRRFPTLELYELSNKESSKGIEVLTYELTG